MTLSPYRVLESSHCNVPMNFINNHDRPFVGGNFIMETRVVETLEDIYISCSKMSNSDLEEALKLSNCTTDENHPHFKLDINPECNNSIESDQTECTSGGTVSVSAPQTESVIIDLEVDECMDGNTPSSLAYDIAESNGPFYAPLNGGEIFNHCIDNSDVDHTNTEVVLHPDYVIFRDNYYTGTKLVFSKCYIKISVSTACAKQGETVFDIVWAVDNLIDIECHLFPIGGMVVMKLRAVSTYAGPSNHISCTSGVEELKIEIVDDNWSRRHKHITSLNEKYFAIWNTIAVPDVNVVQDKKISLGPRCYLLDFEESFGGVVYPKGDPDAVCLSKRDADLLKPDTFINDTVIDFYIQYLKSKTPKEERGRYHFFNSFFFRKLFDMDKNPSSAYDGKAAFQRVRKWTRKVNLFEKDYIFIPVNFMLHWSLIVICHPGEVVNFNDNELDKSVKVPCILHLDSISGCHSGLENLLQSYLWEEWKERKKDVTCGVDLSSRFSNLPFLPIACPQQDNSYDCGLFLLHYLELFLAEAPVNFNPFKPSKFSNFLNMEWFPPTEASLKRTFIQRLIFELVGNENHSSHEGLCLEVNGDSSTSHSVKGIGFTQLLAPSPLDPHSFNPSNMVLKKHFEPAPMAGTLVGHCQSSDHCLNGSILPMKEDINLSKELMDTMADPDLTEEPRISMQSEHAKIETSLATPSCASDDDSDDDITIIESFPTKNETRPSSYEDELGEDNNKATRNNFEFEHFQETPGSLMETSQVLNTMCVSHNNGDHDQHDDDNDDNKAIIESFPIRNETTRSSHDHEKGCENNNAAMESYYLENFPFTCGGDDILIIDSMESYHWEEPPTKKIRLQ